MGKKRSQIIAARRRKTRDERKQAEREAERRERDVADGAGSLVEMKFKSDEMKSENDKKDFCSSDADDGSELVTNCESSAGTKPDESNLDKLSMLDVSIKCETDLVVSSEDTIGPKLRLQAGEKSFACTQCDRKFAQRYQLDRHRRAHTCEKPLARNAPEKSISCPQCDKKCTQKCRLKEHMLVHSGEKPFACEVCDKKFASKKRMRKHHKYHIGDKPFACDDCNEKFIFKSGLNNHRFCHTGEKLSCSDCNKKFARKGSLVRHRNAFHSGERQRLYACPECDKRYYEKLHMTEHYKSHTGERTYVCEKCGNSYAQKNHRCLQTGKKTFALTELTGDGPFVCPTCGKYFAKKGLLRAHFNRHTDKFACSDCGKGFRNITILKEHSYIHTGEKPFVCEICGRDFALKAVLRNHLQLHTDEFACSVCGKKFGTGTSLKEHSYLHTGERPFVCELCGEDFAHKSVFKNHLKLHKNTKERRKIFACSDCEMKFGCKSDLTAHRRIHDKKFSCDVCGKTFAERRYLLAHMRVHTGEKPFACPHCDKKFADKSNMHVHCRKHTGKKRNPLIPIVKIFSIDSPTIESPSPKNHVTKSSISDIDVIDSVHSVESEIMMESTGIQTSPLADHLCGEKSFACSQCDEKFACESDLHAHLGFHASERPTVSEPCTEEVSSNRPPSEQVGRETEQRDSTDSASAVDYHEMVRPISEIDKSVYSRESRIAFETGIDAGELKDVVLSMEPDRPVEHSVEAGMNVLGDVSMDLDRCPSPVHSECSSNVACSEGSPEHKKIDTQEKLDVSSGCDMKFPDIASLYFQEVVHVINQKIYPCSACGMEFTRRHLMKAHRTSAHPRYKPFACDVCNKTFARKCLLVNHMGTHTRTKSFACCFCDMQFLGKNSLLAHRRSAHPVYKPFACEVCKKAFALKGQLANHMKVHTRGTPYACFYCGMKFSWKYALKSHERIHYDEMPQLYYNCDVCSKQFLSKDQLNWHKKKECYLNQHRQTCAGEIPSATARGPRMHTRSAKFAAGKNNDTPVERTESLSNHTGITGRKSSEFEDVLSAGKCEKVGPGKNSSADIDMKPDLATEFNAQKCLLANHMGTHTHRKLFACCYCDMRFSSRKSLKSHKKNHCNENPYTCDVCMKRFVHKAQWISHNKKKCFFNQHRQTYIYTGKILSETVQVPHLQKDGPAKKLTVEPGKNSSDPTDLATKFNEMKRSTSGIDGNILSVDEIKKEYPDGGTEIPARVDNDMLSDLSDGTRRGEPHVDRNPISNNCGTDFSVDTMSQVPNQSQINAGCSTTPFRTFCFIKILKYPRKEKTHECLHCEKKFVTRVGVIAHQITHTGEKPFSCSVCEKRFSRLICLKNHQIIHSNVNPFVCSDCGMEFRDRRKFSNHRKMKCASDKPFPCMVCSKRFTCKSRLINHFRNHLNEKPFVCHECGKKFTLAVRLKRHMQIHTGEMPFVCTVCDKKFCYKKYLNKHYRIHTGEKPFICDVCGKNFSQNAYLKKHMKSHLTEIEEPRVGSKVGEMSIICEVCGKNLSSIRALKTHSGIHTDEKNGPSLTCADCDKKFRQKRELNLHRIKVHSGECPTFSCPDCPASFSSNSLLTEHRIVNHAGDKAFVCLVCGKKFLFKGVLNTHMKCHIGEKSFECPDCHKWFQRRGHLNRHRRLHSGEKPYACKDCDMRFTSKNSLDYHHKRNHTDAKVSLKQNINHRAFQSFTSSP